MPLGYASYRSGGGYGSYGYGRRSPLEELGIDPVVLTPEDEEGWLRSFASSAMSGLATVGNVLDTPGGAVRSLLMGQNPLPGVFDPSLRPDMGTVLSSYGILPENNPGFHPIDDPLDAALDVARFGAEVAVDPLTYLSLGGSAVGKAGQIAKNAGLMQDLSRVAPMVGKRQARLTTTLDDLLAPRIGDEAADILAREQTAMQAAEGLGVDLTQVRGDKLGSLARFAGMPIGTGETAQRIAGRMDDLGSALRYGNIPGTDFSPGTAVARLFNAPTQEATSRVGQEVFGPEIYRGRQEARAAARGRVGEDVSELVRDGGDLADNHSALRRMFEDVDPAAPEVAPVVARVRQRLDEMLPQAREWGIKAPELIDSKVSYFPRYLSQLIRKPGGQSQVASTFDPAAIGREELLKNVEGGTDTINRLTSDSGINALIGAAAKPKEIAAEIGQKFGNEIPELYVRRGPSLRDRTLVDIRNRHSDLATYLRGLGDDVRGPDGMFANHPMQDLLVREQNFAEAMDASKRVLTGLADDRLMAAAAKSKGAGKGVPLGRLLPKIGFDLQPALQKYADLKGLAASTPKELRAIAKIRVPTDLANDLARFHKGITGPDAAGEIIGAIDSVTNLFKAGVTSPWPAFHLRNLVSGQFQNWANGSFSAKSLGEANAIMRGGDTSSLASIPAVKEMLAKRNLPASAAGDVVRELAFQHEVLTRFGSMGTDTVGRQASGATLRDLTKEFPGGLQGDDAFSFAQAGKEFAGRTANTNLDPRGVRGFRGQAESTFGPAVAGQNVGHYVEGLNRLSPFIEQLRKGVDVGEAAKRVAASQVDYSSRALTTFEREAMTRLVPFYKFSRGMVPYTLRQLWEKPGGRLSQSIQAVNDARGTDALTPDFISQTAAIPLGENDNGDPSYLTGLGLMHEDPLSFLAGPQDAGLEALSRLNPLLKIPLEMATGETFFQRGPEGGRPLDELDPLIGRTLSNVGSLFTDEPLAPVDLPNALEQVAANSPLARVLTTARTLSDPRKSAGQKALNLLTGVRTTDVSERAQDALLRERLEQALKGFDGAEVFSKPYLPAEEISQLSPADQQRALQIQALLNLLAKRGRERNQAEGR